LAAVLVGLSPALTVDTGPAHAVGGMAWSADAVAAQQCPVRVQTSHDGVPGPVKEWCDQQYQQMASKCSETYHDDSRRAAQCHREAAQWYSDCLAGKHLNLASGPPVPGVRVRQ
ncbi:hypothetical protein, partial [Nocardia vaccinii]|uniref:hypothetical protein n=1 Tax=Nocardia vaccinii TaxID=1822 RepID=UPI000B145226